MAQRLAALVEEHDPDVLLAGAGPEGRDLAGALSALTGRGVLANAIALRGSPDGPIATHSVFGGKLITESALAGGRGIVTIRPNTVTAEPAAERREGRDRRRHRGADAARGPDRRPHRGQGRRRVDR